MQIYKSSLIGIIIVSLASKQNNKKRVFFNAISNILNTGMLTTDVNDTTMHMCICYQLH